MHAGGGQHILAAVGQAHAIRTQAQDREVRGTAPQVDHQHQALARQAALVVQRGGNRLELERHLVKPDRARRLQQGLLGQGIALGVVIDEMHRPPHHHAPGCCAQGLAGALTQHPQESRDDVEEADRAVVDDGGLEQQRTAQQAFQRAHQPALGAAQVMCQRIAAEMGAALLGVVEHGGRHGQRLAFERNQTGQALVVGPGHGRVGSTEVDAERALKRRSHEITG